MKKIILHLLLFSFCMLNCNTTDPPPPDRRKLTLTFEDASCTEVWIQLTTENLQLPLALTVKTTDAGGNLKSQILNLKSKDSLLFIDSLLPNKNYTLKAELSSIQNPVTSNEITATTMDTTSHNFTFETWTFGDVGSSVLYDVAIIDENNIWAVGEINIADTSENGYTIYNAVHWDGNKWELKRIMFKTICGQPSSQNAYPASSIIAFSENEIWVAQKGDQIAKIENGIQTQSICMPWTFSINKIWGTSSNDLYVVGNNGNIAHYNGSQWIRIESGTDLDIYDIWGDYNENNNNYDVIVVASKLLVNQEKKIIKINKDGNVTSLLTNGIPSNITGIWFKNKVFYVVGSGMFRKIDITSASNWKSFHYGLTNYHISDIRGNNYNDIIASGSFGELVHFNGVNWKFFTDQTYMNGAWGGTIKDNAVCCVGLKENKAIITLGKR